MAWAGFAANPLSAAGDFKGGLLQGAGVRRAFKTGWEMSFKGTMIFNAPMAAFALGSAPRGHKVSAGAEALSTGFGALAGGLLFGLPGAVVGGIVADMPISSQIGKGVQALHDFDRNQRRLNAGGGFQDTEASYTMRQEAAREMAGSLQNARQWLGKEGAFLHA